MSDPMRIRASMVGDRVEVKALIAHEMETGLRKDADGKTIPAHFIERIVVTCNGTTVLSAQWGTSTNNRKAKFYSITKKGRKRLTEDAAYWQRLSSVMGRVLGMRGEGEQS